MMPDPPRDALAATIVINCCDDLDYLPQAIESALAQSVPADAVIVVDDGSRSDPGPIVARYPGVRLIVQRNAGLAAARNTGLAAVATGFVAFLDADDVLHPAALEAGFACFARSPGAAFVFGAYRRVDRAGRPIGDVHFRPTGTCAYADLLRTNLIAMHATVLYRTRVIREFGGFDPRLRLCEDYDLYLRIVRRRPIASHPVVVADYRQHGRNISSRHRAMLDTVRRILRRHRDPPTPALREAWREAQHLWADYYGHELLEARRAARRAGRHFLFARHVKDQIMVELQHALPERIRASPLGRLGASLRARLVRWPPRIGRVRLGQLDSPRPISLNFGFDRGLPIDRYYIEDFLARHGGDVRGRVLEIGDDTYSRRFGDDRIVRQDVLHVRDGIPGATMYGELTDPAVLGDDLFDCVVLTQTLHLIYDFRIAVERLHAALRPGGVVLLTVPGITPVDRGEWRDSWYWSFTRASMQRLFGEVFGAANVQVGTYGNVYAATLYLQGLSVDEARCEHLDVEDAAYPVIVGVRARKPE